jgi:hypothetical protein
MQQSVYLRFGMSFALAWLSTVALPHCPAQGLPPTQPTTLPANNSMPAPIAGTTTTASQTPNRPHHADVTFVDGNIDVRANDSSLNQILRSISRTTGLKITGGVQDERVFGNYGPAPISAVLATLLDGTGTNILFLAGDASNPPQLVLTPRGGGATPPAPDSPTYAAYDQAPPDNPATSQPAQNIQVQSLPPQPPAPSGPVSIPQPLNNVNGSPLNTSPPTSGIVDAPNPPPPGSTTGTAPNGTLTPQQVYQQLLQRQQQQQQQQPTPPPPQ